MPAQQDSPVCTFWIGFQFCTSEFRCRKTGSCERQWGVWTWQKRIANAIGTTTTTATSTATIVGWCVTGRPTAIFYVIVGRIGGARCWCRWRILWWCFWTQRQCAQRWADRIDWSETLRFGIECFCNFPIGRRCILWMAIMWFRNQNLDRSLFTNAIWHLSRINPNGQFGWEIFQNINDWYTTFAGSTL